MGALKKRKKDYFSSVSTSWTSPWTWILGEPPLSWAAGQRDLTFKHSHTAPRCPCLCRLGLRPCPIAMKATRTCSLGWEWGPARERLFLWSEEGAGGSGRKLSCFMCVRVCVCEMFPRVGERGSAIFICFAVPTNQLETTALMKATHCHHTNMERTSVPTALGRLCCLSSQLFWLCRD